MESVANTCKHLTPLFNAISNKAVPHNVEKRLSFGGSKLSAIKENVQESLVQEKSKFLTRMKVQP